MIDIVEYVTDTLSPLGIIASFQVHPKNKDGSLPDQYVTFMEISESPEFEAGDVELETERYVQLNIWSRYNYHSLVQSVRSAMEGAGFQRTFAFDAPYTDGDSHFNKVLRFVYYDQYE